MKISRSLDGEVSRLRISDLLQEDPPHTCSARQVPKQSKWLHPSFLQLVDSFGDASTAVSFDALQFNTSMDADEDLDQACPAFFRLVGLGLITISCRIAGPSFKELLSRFDRLLHNSLLSHTLRELLAIILHARDKLFCVCSVGTRMMLERKYMPAHFFPLRNKRRKYSWRRDLSHSYLTMSPSTIPMCKAQSPWIFRKTSPISQSPIIFSSPEVDGDSDI